MHLILYFLINNYLCILKIKNHDYFLNLFLVNKLKKAETTRINSIQNFITIMLLLY